MIMKSNCKQCNMPYSAAPSLIKCGYTKFCSKHCYTNYQHVQNISNIINHNCIVCNKGMRLTPYLIRMKRKCCSIKCQHELQKKRMVRICQTCNIEFKSNPRVNKKFCSKKCRNDQSKRELTCEQCKTTFIAINKTRNPKTKYQFCSNKCKFIWGRGKAHPKMSEWMATHISDGTFHNHGNYKQGFIKNKSSNKKEFYASSYEKIRMKQLNDLMIIWTKNHKIKIPYTDPNGVSRNYIPDFLINNHLIEEVKPTKLLTKHNNPLKFKAAEDYCKNNNLEFKIITEKELNI